ncbi:hypothetical protein [Mycetocola spongiae]|uniref:hypothetical protein n=1 Tax=Mycetocola spongiae TaxID=2859226 RepID=UPI001CF3E4DD|nr:hypothetical protein [Mycetocola spongiae]UCR89013.1 hypothetical protein KXZ72_13880 [Mycetocola spongiae]
MKRIIPILAAVLLLAGCAQPKPESPSASASASPSASASASPSGEPTPEETSNPEPTEAPAPEETSGGPNPVPPTVETSPGIAAQTQTALLASLDIASFRDACSVGSPYCYVDSIVESAAGTVTVNFTGAVQSGNAGPIAGDVMNRVAASVPGLNTLNTSIAGAQVGSAARP